MTGWVKLHRRIAEWEWSDDPYMMAFFIHLIVKASNRDTKWKGKEVKRGQVVFGREKWAKETGISQQRLRTCIERLKSTGEITIKTTNKYTIITICKFNEYQATEEPSNQQSNQRINQQSTSNQPHREKLRSKEVKNTTFGQDNHAGLADWLLVQ